MSAEPIMPKSRSHTMDDMSMAPRRSSLSRSRTDSWLDVPTEHAEQVWNLKETISYWTAILSILSAIFYGVGTVVLVPNNCSLDILALPDIEGVMHAWSDCTWLAASWCGNFSGYLIYFQTINAQHHHGKHEHDSSMRFAVVPEMTFPHMGALCQLLGSLWFTISCTSPFTSVDLSDDFNKNMWVAGPALIGCLHFATAAVCEGEYNRWRDFGAATWQAPVWQSYCYFLGALFFIVGVVFQFNHWNEHVPFWQEWLVVPPWTAGSLLFIKGSWMDLVMWKTQQYGMGYSNELSSPTRAKKVDWRQQLMVGVYVCNICMLWCDMFLHIYVPTLNGNALVSVLDLMQQFFVYVVILILASAIHKTPKEHPYDYLLWMMRFVSVWNFAYHATYLYALVVHEYNEPWGNSDEL